MKFYLNGQEVQVEVAPRITETLDESLDSVSVVLAANNVALPIAPMQSFNIQISDNETLYFYVESDQVEVFSKEPLTYKHRLNLIQNTRKLAKHIVRNTSFSQPAENNKYSLASGSQLMNWDKQNATMNVLGENISKYLTKSSKEKIIGTPYILINDICGFSGLASYPDELEIKQNMSIQDINGKVTVSDQVAFAPTFQVMYSGGSETITVATDIIGGKIEIEKPLYCPKLKNILENHTNIYISASGILRKASDLTQYPKLLFNASQGVGLISFSVQCYIYASTYYNTCYDILEKLLNRQRKNYNGHQKDALFSLPAQNSDLYNLLTSTIAPNFTFTQCSLYECVAEVFRLYDAIFTMDQNGVLGIEYLNEQSKTPLTQDLSNLSITMSDNQFNNGLISYYQDARIIEKVDIIAPTTESLGVPSDESEYVIRLPHAIDNIRKIEVLVKSCGDYEFYDTFGNPPIDITGVGNVWVDITQNTYEESLWSLLSISATHKTDISQENSIYYKRGGNDIYIGNHTKYFLSTNYALWGAMWCALGNTGLLHFNENWTSIVPSSQNYLALRFRVEYETTIDGRVQVESITKKYDGESLIDQYSGAVDINKMGLNMLGVSLKTGEPILNASHQITSWNDRIKKGSILVQNGKKWVANICSYTFLTTDKIVGEISFTSNFNALTQHIRLSKQRRLSNISSELTLKSEDNIIEYIYYSATTQSGTYDNNTAVQPLIENAIFWSFNGDGTEKGYENCNYGCINVNPFPTYANGIAIPTSVYYAGNMLCFEMSFNSPIVAGNNTYKDLDQNKNFTKAVKYTTDGFIDQTNVGIFCRKDLQQEAIGQYNTYPVVTFDEQPVIKLYNYYVLKQPNEVFALNYELCFLPEEINKDRDFLSQEFMKNLFYITGNGNSHQLYLSVCENTDKYDIFDIKAIGTRKIAITSVSHNSLTESKGFQIVFNYAIPSGKTESDTFNAFAITDENDNIYFATNLSGNYYNGSVRITFMPKISRK